MATYPNLLFYTVNPSGIFSTGINGFATWTGASAPDGNATIFDTEAGVEGQTLDDDSNGGETATANVYTPGGTSTGSTVDAEVTWTLRDTVTGATFEVVQFEVENGGAAGFYTLSEIPLVAGRSYETLDYHTNPDVNAGNPVFTYADYDRDAFSAYTVNSPPGTVDGTAGADTIDIDLGYTDGDGDSIDNSGNIIHAGDGNDSVESGSGDDWIGGGAGDDTIDTEFGENTIEGGTGNDSIDAGNGGDLIYGGTGNDTIDAQQANDTVFGGDGNDSILGRSGRDSIEGGAGSDTIIGGSDSDTILGGDGDDSLDAQWESDTISGGAGSDTIIAGSGDDSLSGDDDADTFVLEAGFGSDTVVGGEGTTTGTDDDTIDHASLSGPVTVTLTGDEAGTTTDGSDTLTFSEIEGFTLTSAADVFSGISSDANATVDAGGGADTVSFDDGDQSVLGGAGADNINAGDDDDTVYGGDDGDTITGGFGNDLIYGDAGNDSISSGYGADTVYAGDGDDTMWVSRSDFDYVDAGSGSDVIYVVSDFGDDTVYGGEAGTDVDTLDFYYYDYLPAGVSVTFSGDELGTFTDSFGSAQFYQIEALRLTNQADTVDASASNAAVILEGLGGADTLTGGAGDDTLIGGAGDDSLVGNAGAETFQIGDTFGNDTIVGGEGGTDNDVIDLSALTGPVTVTYSGDEAGTITDGTDTITFSEIEQVIFTNLADVVTRYSVVTNSSYLDGADGDDTITGSNTTSGSDTLLGGAGNDELRGWDGSDSLVGGTGDDTITADSGSDTVQGGAGNDDLRNWAGAAIMDGGDDADRFVVYNSGGGDFNGVTITGGEGGTDSDTIDFGSLGSGVTVTYSGDEAGSATDGTDMLSFSETEAIVATAFADSLDAGAAGSGATLDGGGGSDTIIGSAGADSLLGGDDSDTISGGAGSDYLEGGDGADLLMSGTGDDTLIGGAGDDTLKNSAGDDSLVGGTGNDSIVATIGNDTLEGESGNDTLIGGIDDDSLVGGAGDDSMVGDFAAGGLTEPGRKFAYEFYELDSAGSLSNLADAGFTGADNSNTPVGQGVIDSTDVDALSAHHGTNADTFGVKLVTYLTVTTGGTYDFALSADDGAKLFIDGVEIINHDGVHGYTSANGSTSLTAGEHLVEIIYFENNGGEQLGMTISGPDTGGSPIAIESANVAVTFDDTLEGDAGSDTIQGGLGADSMTGGDDADTFIIEDDFGNDTIVGGEGGADSDTLDLSALTGSVTVTYTGDEAGTITDGTDTITFSEIENLILTDQADVVDASLDTAGTNIDAGAGNDTIEYGQGDSTVRGGAGDDFIDDVDGAQYSGNDSIDGGTGDDTIWTGDGADTILGGDGNDQISGEQGNDVIKSDEMLLNGEFEFGLTGGAQYINETLEGWQSDTGFLEGWADGHSGVNSTDGGNFIELDRYSSQVDNFYQDVQTSTGVSYELTFDALQRGSDTDSIEVLWNNVLVGTYVPGSNTTWQTFSVTVTGTGGLDRLEFRELASEDDATGPLLDAISLTASGADSIHGGSGTDSILGGGGDDTIDGGDNTDTIYGGAGNDSIFDSGGATSDDTIYGGDGNDTISGGVREDYLDGGADADTFIIEDNFGADTIVGGEGGTDSDTIDLSALTGPVTVTYTGDEAGTITDGTDTITFSEIERIVTTDLADLVDTQLDGVATYIETRDGDDTIVADGGGDTVDAGSGNDSIQADYGSGTANLIGGTGTDTLDWDGEGTDGVGVTLTSTDAGSYNWPTSGDGTFSGFEAYELTTQDDTFDGSAATGDLNVGGQAGADSLTGGTGNDSLQGGSGADTLIGGAGSDTLVAGSDDDSLLGGDGNDILYAGTGNDTIDGGANDDVIDIDDDDGTVTVIGGSGNDTLDFDRVVGTAGFDATFTGNGTGTFAGLDGLSTASGIFSEIEVVQGSGGADRFDASVATSSVTLVGQSGGDTLTGGSGDDSIDGGDDADIVFINSGFGNDTIVGGEGGTDNDTLDLSALTGSVTVTYTGDEAGTITDGTDTITFSEIENLILTDQADSLDGTADSAGIYVEAGNGNDTITTGSGDDTVLGQGGDNAVTLGAGNDLYTGANLSQDTVYGGIGNDTINMEYHATGNEAYGEDGDDSLVGNNGNQALYGGDGNDTIRGGNDLSTSDTDTLDGGIGDDCIVSGASASTDEGWEDNGDLMTGGAGQDTLIGGGADDTLEGGTGNDSLTGGLADDTFVYAAGDGDDTITDFNTDNSGTLSDGDTTNNDAIDLSGFYDNLSELYADQADDGVLNQSNATDIKGRTVNYGDNSSFGGGSLTFTGASADNSFFTAENTNVVCFTAGTAIRTVKGDVLIEDLKVGDLVITLDNGPQPIRWIGARTVGPPELAKTPKLRPILIPKGVFGAERNLLVSPLHGILWGQDHLVRAKHLVDAPKSRVRVARGKRRVTYVHLLFDRHEVIFAENVMAESLYPGLQAFQTLGGAAMSDLLTHLPSTDPANPAASFGATVRPFLKRKEALDTAPVAGSRGA